MLNELNYNDLKILELDFDLIDDLSSIENKYDIVKIFTKPQQENLKLLCDYGYIFVDRTLEVCVSLSKIDNCEKLVRLPIVKTSEYKKEITKIAQKSFPYDRRFNLRLKNDKNLADFIIAKWIDELECAYVCFYKDLPIGFLSLVKMDEKNVFVHLAAVDERYRMSGAAMSLYANAIQVAKNSGYVNLNGKISSQNVAVMNLYGSFGAKFSNPIDIYIKEF